MRDFEVVFYLKPKSEPDLRDAEGDARQWVGVAGGKARCNLLGGWGRWPIWVESPSR